MSWGVSLNRNLKLNFPIDRLRHAVAAADYGSLRQAAEALSIKQSTLSRSIQLLEHRFGAKIFERSRTGVRTTPMGQQFLRMARSIIEQLEALTAITKASGRGETGRLAIGFCTSLTAGNLRASLLDFRQKFPHIEFATVERRRVHLATGLRNGLLDVLIVTGGLALSNSNIKPLWSERLFVVLPEEHPLAEQDIVYWTDLRDQTIILSEYDPGREIEDHLVSRLVSPDERPRIERHNISRGVVKSLVTMMFGISIVQESEHRSKFRGAGLSGVARWRRIKSTWLFSLLAG
ncbi:MAG TPA: LysR family transcriptional regulator [Gemmataceae bacterium]|jgi:DNA-binding transcriptional LysR family regulator|nr:LysR family transcriptional regulator [Gemmataceae bacterium]